MTSKHGELVPPTCLLPDPFYERRFVYRSSFISRSVSAALKVFLVSLAYAVKSPDYVTYSVSWLRACHQPGFSRDPNSFTFHPGMFLQNVVSPSDLGNFCHTISLSDLIADDCARAALLCGTRLFVCQLRAILVHQVSLRQSCAVETSVHTAPTSAPVGKRGHNDSAMVAKSSTRHLHPPCLLTALTMSPSNFGVVGIPFGFDPARRLPCFSILLRPFSCESALLLKLLLELEELHVEAPCELFRVLISLVKLVGPDFAHRPRQLFYHLIEERSAELLAPTLKTQVVLFFLGLSPLGLRLFKRLPVVRVALARRPLASTDVAEVGSTNTSSRRNG